MEQASDGAAAAKSRDEKSLLEKLAEMEEKKVHHDNIKWTPLPPPNLELYLRKPVVLLNWDDSNMVSNSEQPGDQCKDEEYTTATCDVINLDSIADDDSFADLDISELTARLEDAEKELSILGSQDKDSEVEKQGEVVSEGGNEHIPPAPDFNDDSGDSDEYGSGSDMDLFADEDYDRLYDNVDQQLQQGGDAGEEDQRKSFGFSLPALVEVGGPPSMPLTSSSPIYPHCQGSTSDSQNRNHSADVKPILQRQASPHPRREWSSSKLQRSIVEKTLETIRQFTDGTSSCDVDQPHTSEQQDAPRARSSSSDYKFSSPDSDDLDPPPVNWGCGSRPMAPASSATGTPSTFTSTGTSSSTHNMIKDEQPIAHCSKDILQASATSQQPPSVAEKCPMCNFSFPRR